MLRASVILLGVVGVAVVLVATGAIQSGSCAGPGALFVYLALFYLPAARIAVASHGGNSILPATEESCE